MDRITQQLVQSVGVEAWANGLVVKFAGLTVISWSQEIKSQWGKKDFDCDKVITAPLRMTTIPLLAVAKAIKNNKNDHVGNIVLLYLQYFASVHYQFFADDIFQGVGITAFFDRLGLPASEYLSPFIESQQVSAIPTTAENFVERLKAAGFISADDITNIEQEIKDLGLGEVILNAVKELTGVDFDQMITKYAKENQPQKTDIQIFLDIYELLNLDKEKFLKSNKENQLAKADNENNNGIVNKIENSLINDDLKRKSIYEILQIFGQILRGGIIAKIHGNNNDEEKDNDDNNKIGDNEKIKTELNYEEIRLLLIPHETLFYIKYTFPFRNQSLRSLINTYFESILFKNRLDLVTSFALIYLDPKFSNTLSLVIYQIWLFLHLFSFDRLIENFKLLPLAIRILVLPQTEKLKKKYIAYSKDLKLLVSTKEDILKNFLTLFYREISDLKNLINYGLSYDFICWIYFNKIKDNFISIKNNKMISKSKDLYKSLRNNITVKSGIISCNFCCNSFNYFEISINSIC